MISEHSALAQLLIGLNGGAMIDAILALALLLCFGPKMTQSTLTLYALIFWIGCWVASLCMILLGVLVQVSVLIKLSSVLLGLFVGAVPLLMIWFDSDDWKRRKKKIKRAFGAKSKALLAKLKTFAPQPGRLPA